MSNNLDKFDSELKNILNEYQPAYSSSAWNKLDKSINRSFTKWYFAAASVAVVVVSIIAYNLSGLDSSGKVIAKHSTVIEKSTESVEGVFINEMPINETTYVSEDNNTKSNSSLEEPHFLEEKSEATVADNEEIQQNNLSEDIVTEEFNPVENAQDIIEDSNSKINSQIVLSAKTGCEPLELSFSIADLPEGTSVLWDLGDNYVSSDISFSHTFRKNGKYSIKLNILTSTESYSVEEEVWVRETPISSFRFEEEDGILILENLSEAYKTLQWSFTGVETDEENPSFEMLYTGNYSVSLEVMNEYGCSMVKKEIIPYKVKHQVFAPDAFTPDGDGMNDEFLVKYEAREGYKYTLQIFNSFGKKLFETQDKNQGWDGTCPSTNSSINIEKFLWRLIIEDPLGNKVIKEDYFEKL